MNDTAQRWKSSALLGVTFALLSGAIWLLGLSLPPYGRLIAAAMYFSSPFLWFFIKFKGVGVPSVTMAIAVIAPYPLIGLFAGYWWPLVLATKGKVISQIALRFLVAVVALGFIGLCLSFWAMANDS